ncbi:MAG TPA: UDP-N-acetylmuramoyl-tripeptide--D-alanyl-D-alanine ligase [Steroidobacteraceae bacterium]
MKRTLSDAARVVGGELIGEDRRFGCVCTDSRTLKPGSLFVALRGPNFDGAAFVQAAAAQGAIGALVERATPGALPQVLVPDTLRALQELAKNWRADFSLPVIAVAGSNGKTTAKEMTAAILSRMGLCMATHGNLNNHIGVPVTLMRLEASHRSAVIEMGANAIGDVAALMSIARPTVGLITNAGAEHLEGFGNLDGVAKGEGETVSCLAAEGTAIINADDAYVGYWRGISGAKRIVTFGVHAQADFAARNIFQGIERGEFATRFTLISRLGERAIMLKAGGAHNIGNALAAAAAASAAGASLEDVALGLADFRAVAGRLQLKPGTRGSWIIDDSYNANPSSVRAAMEVLRALTGPTWLVLGDMAELGESSQDSHAHIGSYARDCGIKRLFAMGPLSSRAVETFGAGGEWFAEADSLARRLQAELAPGVTVLIKGSRINRLERVVQALTGGGNGPKPMMRAS